jgi:hypothetical protein
MIGIWNCTEMLWRSAELCAAPDGWGAALYAPRVSPLAATKNS